MVIWSGELQLSCAVAKPVISGSTEALQSSAMFSGQVMVVAWSSMMVNRARALTDCPQASVMV